MLCISIPTGVHILRPPSSPIQKGFYENLRHLAARLCLEELNGMSKDVQCQLTKLKHWMLWIEVRYWNKHGPLHTVCSRREENMVLSLKLCLTGCSLLTHVSFSTWAVCFIITDDSQKMCFQSFFTFLACLLINPLRPFTSGSTASTAPLLMAASR